MADACMMASKLAYENDKTILKVVTEDWKMHVAEIFECINKYHPSNPTRFFMLMDRAEDAQAIIVAFRGTMFFNAYDWSTNFDFSWYEFPGIGRVHVGCLEALSMVDRQDMATFSRLKRNISQKRASRPEKPAAGGIPLFQSSGDDVEENNIFEDARTESISSEDRATNIESLNEKKTEDVHAEKPRLFMSGLSEANAEENRHLLAYDGARDKLKELLSEHKNAKVYITGHSLGGGLATVFTSLLFHSHEDAITSRLAAVYTFGQPKVGDTEFAANMSINLNYPENRYFRVVYSNDLLTRLPYDDLVFRFKHLGPCFFYTSNYEGETVKEEPDKSFTSSNLLPTHATATWELLQSLMLRYKFGDASKETVASTVFRLAGLLFPGVAAHSPVNYINAIRLGSEVLDSEVMPSADNIADE